MRWVASGLLLFFWVPTLGAQPDRPSGSRFDPRMLQERAIQAALQWVEAHREAHVQEWIRLTEIPAPSGREARRAAYIRAEMERMGLDSVHIDAKGNVVGILRGRSRHPAIAVAAHMDTVHPLEEIRVRREGDTLYAPGVLDDTAGLVVMLQTARALRASRVPLSGDVILIATVQEEVGLKGMEYWLNQNPRRADMVIAVDGNLGDVPYGALGIKWFRFHYRAYGAHTMQSLGQPNPNRAVARAIQDIYRLPLPHPSGAFVIYNVGLIGGGTVPNAVSQHSYFTVDLRSPSARLLQEYADSILARARRAAEQERVRFELEVLNDAPAGGTEAELADRREHPLVQTAVHVLNYLEVGRQLGRPVRPVATGSTDANMAVVRGIPAIAYGRCFGRDQHTLQEAAHIPSAFTATKGLILLLASLLR
ncbi:MAG: M20/M25/M40 family metallo-hydrolase [Bacteroidetes bacterium]|nr:M20/M25/M40 family metallo-hydrolase [Rhodothermia bacterium]MCS7155365.1 M20/M25/M40 family metallo-hydrolase [Bacteroidota bacterium]MCX7907542.1 M20/M25/M40 family metallo-hydrolase [Bacteroidota bacterium]MDW8138536.1 M20/M25/M40 family metallo-hydrolase [Bacteroidota bacterium]MDW8284527.1 M20/M25/M40 family metallo-hydrolase [Bacteroidota bacterium]